MLRLSAVRKAMRARQQYGGGSATRRPSRCRHPKRYRVELNGLGEQIDTADPNHRWMPAAPVTWCRSCGAVKALVDGAFGWHRRAA